MADGRHFQKPLNRCIAVTVRSIFTKFGTVTHMLTLSIHWTNERDAVCRTNSCAPEEPRTSCRCTVAPPCDYDWTIRAWRL